MRTFCGACRACGAPHVRDRMRPRNVSRRSCCGWCGAIWPAVLELVATDRIDAVLATAAAEDYAMSLGRRLGFRHVLATASNRRHGEPANSGAQKREQVLALLDECGWHGRPIILFTDHVDDLPLMHDSTTVYWCGPLRELDRAATAATNARFVFCGDLEVGEARAASVGGLSGLEAKRLRR